MSRMTTKMLAKPLNTYTPNMVKICLWVMNIENIDYVLKFAKNI